MRTKAILHNSYASFVQKVEDLKLLVKYRLSMTVVFTSAMAYLLAVSGSIDWLLLSCLTIGGFLVTGAANALNQALEKSYDKLMKRTANRPMAAGRMSMSEGVLWAGFMSLTGIVLLAVVHPYAAFFGMLSLVIYAFLYTPLKRVSPIAVAVGAVPGALPMLIGATAAAGEVTAFAIVLFSIQFFWQFPHFWAIGWLGFDDYKKAGYKFMHSVDGHRDRNTGLQSFVYAGILVPMSLLLRWSAGYSWVSVAIVAFLSMYFAWKGWQLYQQNDRQAAKGLMFTSLAYLPLVLLVLFIEKLII